MKIVIIALGCIASGTMAAPAYISCEMTDRPGFIIEVTADEENQNVTTTIVKTGYTFRNPAVFSPTDVSWHDKDFYYQVSRTDLTIKTWWKVGSNTGGQETGSCKIVLAPKRAF